jgi:NAD(P)-dependent dehydrogenase (short-subunit alcohol dehydrogenase family)
MLCLRPSCATLSSVGRTALVTGGAGAIGGAIVEALRADGHEVAVLDRTGDFACDLSDQADVRRTAGAVLERHGSCEILIHAAAAFDRFTLEDLDLERWHHVQAVNVESALVLAGALTPGMAERGFGRIVFVTSDTVWLSPGPEFLAYIASKSALEGIARALARSLGASGITVNSVEPGLTPTPTSVNDIPPEAFEAVLERQSLKRTLEPADTAAAVAFLCTEAAGAITGQTLCADGGLLTR